MTTNIPTLLIFEGMYGYAKLKIMEVKRLIDELKKMESALLEGQEIEKSDQILSEGALDKLALKDVIEVERKYRLSRWGQVLRGQK